jgi:hypothetical protein
LFAADQKVVITAQREPFEQKWNHVLTNAENAAMRERETSDVGCIIGNLAQLELPREFPLRRSHP